MKEREKEREKCILKMRELFRGKFILRLVKKPKKGKDTFPLFLLILPFSL